MWLDYLTFLYKNKKQRYVSPFFVFLSLYTGVDGIDRYVENRLAIDLKRTRTVEGNRWEIFQILVYSERSAALFLIYVVKKIISASGCIIKQFIGDIIGINGIYESVNNVYMGKNNNFYIKNS